MAGVARIPRSRVPRSRGGLCGTLLLLLGAWGALIPFVGLVAGLYLSGRMARTSPE